MVGGRLEVEDVLGAEIDEDLDFFSGVSVDRDRMEAALAFRCSMSLACDARWAKSA